MSGGSKQFDALLVPLKNDQLEQLKITRLLKEFSGREKEYGERLQYALYCYCQKKSKDDVANLRKISELASKCYSDSCLVHFTHPARFTGCLATIHKYLIVNDEMAIALILRDCLKGVFMILGPWGEDCSTNIFAVHHSTVESAWANKEKELGLLSLRQSLEPLRCIQAPNASYAEKAARNTRHVLNGTQKLTVENSLDLLKEAKEEITRLNGSETDAIEEYLTKRICYSLSTALDSGDKKAKTKSKLVDIARKIKAEIDVYLGLVEKGDTQLQEAWHGLIDVTLTANSSNLEAGLEGACVIMKESDTKEVERSCAMMLSLISPELWTAARGDTPSVSDVFALYRNVYLSVHNWWITYRECNRERACNSMGRLCGTLAMLCRSCTKHMLPTDTTALELQSEENPGLVEIMINVLFISRQCVLELTACGVNLTTTTYIWSQTAVRVVNSVEDVMTLCTKNAADWSYVKVLCRSLLSDDGPPLLPIERNRIKLLYDRWVLALVNQGNVLDAMEVRATQAAQNPEDIHLSVSSWLILQNQLPNSHKNKHQTFADFVMKELVGTYDLDVKKLLLAQLKGQGTAFTPSASFGMPQADNSTQVTACMRAWTQFKGLRPTVPELALGLMYVVMAAVGDVTPEMLARLIADCKKIMKLVEKLKKGALRTVYEGALHLALFLCNGREGRHRLQAPNETRNVLLSQLRKEAKEKAKYGEEVDLNVTCDLEPRADILAIDHEVEKLIQLDAALFPLLSLFSVANNKLVDLAELAQEELDLTANCLLTIGNYALLLGDVNMAASAWAFLYQLARANKNYMVEVSVLSKLVLYCGIEEYSEILKLGEKSALSLLEAAGRDMKKFSQQELVAYLSFTLARAAAAIISGSFKSALGILTECLDYFSLVKHESDYYLLRARFLCLIGQLLLISGPDDHVTIETCNIDHAVYLTFSNIKAALTSGSKVNCSVISSEEVLLTMHSLTMWCADVFMSLNKVDYVRAFLEDLYEILQKLGLVVRTAQVLGVLINVDLAVLALNDMERKLAFYFTMVSLPTIKAPHDGDSSTKHNPVGADGYLRAENALSPMRCGPPKGRSRSPMMDLLRHSPSRTSHRDKCDCRVCHLPAMWMLQLHARSMAGMLLTHQKWATDGAVYLKEAVLQPEWQRKYQAWDIELARLLSNVTATSQSRFFAREAQRVWIEAVCHCCRAALYWNGQIDFVASLLRQCDERMSELAPATLPLMRFTLYELHICLRTFAGWKQPKEGHAVKVCLLESFAGLMTPARAKEGVEALSPQKHSIYEEGSQLTPVVRRGRRIFDATPNPNPPSFVDPDKLLTMTVSKKTVGFDCPLETPAKVETVAKSEPKSQVESAVKELKKKKAKQSGAASAMKTPGNRRQLVAAATSVKLPSRRGRAVLPSDSEESEIEATPSPVSRSTHKLPLSRVRATRSTRCLIFDESEQAEANASKDLFDSFERRLKISDGPEKNKTDGKKKKKVEAPVTLRKAPR